VTLARVAGGHSGGWSARLANTGAAAVSCNLNDAPNWVAKTVAGKYTAQVWVRGETAGATVRLKLSDWSGSTQVGSATAQATLTTAWQLLKLTYTPPSPGSSLDYSVHVTSAAPGTCFYADDAALYAG
jgi:hypothetical protein